jgi:predicted homoserine dehydrogenase-like protein
MNLHALLRRREADGKPLRVGLIGAGKFGSMYLSQVRRTPGVRLTAVSDLDPARARAALAHVGWSDAEVASVAFTDEAVALIGRGDVDIVIDATGSPAAGIAHVLACCERGKHVVMVNVEADALAGPLLAKRAREAGIVYSLAYGDQPALICEMVDWAHARRAAHLRQVHRAELAGADQADAQRLAVGLPAAQQGMQVHRLLLDGS